MRSDVLLDKVINDMTMLDVDQIEEFLSMATTALICTMRGLHGDQFVKDYLTAALNDTDPPIIKPILVN